MKRKNFDLIVRLVKERSGVTLGEDKGYLVESRLMPVARRRGMAELDDLAWELRTNPDEELLVEITEAMLTNESYFFRDFKPFEILRRALLPRLVEARRQARAGPIRIWSAGCSCGQEPYSIAMILNDEAPNIGPIGYEILGTDLSTRMLDKARAGLYSQYEVQRGLPVRLLLRHFRQEGESWRIDRRLRERVELRRFNLLDSYRDLGRFDVVMCRNVMIYFDDQQKRDTLRRIAEAMADDGILLLGAGETALNLSDAFAPLPGGSLFVRTARGAPQALHRSAG